LAQTANFRKYQQQIMKNSRALAQEFKKLGFRLVADGTDNHLMVLDLRNIGLSGLEAEKLLEQTNITANRNVVIGDKSPFHPSGIRIGVPAVTTRGMKEKEMKKIANLMARVLINKEKPAVIKKEIEGLCHKFPL